MAVVVEETSATSPEIAIDGATSATYTPVTAMTFLDQDSEITARGDVHRCPGSLGKMADGWQTSQVDVVADSRNKAPEFW